jgi:hypothetical protein
VTGATIFQVTDAEYADIAARLKIAANCALGESCKCTRKAKPWLCDMWGRSVLGAPSIVGRDPAYKSGNAHQGTRISPQRRKELKEAGELSILNGRHFTEGRQPGDRSVAEIRRDAKEKAQARRKQKGRVL